MAFPQPFSLVNSAGDACKRGGKFGGTGGHTNREPSELYYCGKFKNECLCGDCDGRCGPTNGCPCHSCWSLFQWIEGTLGVGTPRYLNKDGDACGFGTEIGDHCYGQQYKGLSSTRILYCGKQKDQCNCGNCDGRCGPNNGCPCNSCWELTQDLHKLSMGEQHDSEDPRRLGGRNIYFNGSGHFCWTGYHRLGSSGGDTARSPSGLFYCGRKKNQCRCGYCDGRCGPNNGCPCEKCLELVENFVEDVEEVTEEQGPHDSNATAVNSDSEHSNTPVCQEENTHCIICLEAKRTICLVPCGHFGFCSNCARRFAKCSICRRQITARLKVYNV